MNKEEKQPPQLLALLIDLFFSLQKLVMQHIELYKLKLQDSFQLAIKAVLSFILSVFIICVTVILFGVFLIFVFSLILPMWLSALIVVLIYLLTSILMVLLGLLFLQKIQKNKEEVENETYKTVEEVKKWVKKLK